jgi:hypothetical protein
LTRGRHGERSVEPAKAAAKLEGLPSLILRAKRDYRLAGLNDAACS